PHPFLVRRHPPTDGASCEQISPHRIQDLREAPQSSFLLSIWFVWSIWFPWAINQTNQKNKTNQTTPLPPSPKSRSAFSKGTSYSSAATSRLRERNIISGCSKRLFSKAAGIRLPI